LVLESLTRGKFGGINLRKGKQPVVSKKKKSPLKWESPGGRQLQGGKRTLNKGKGGKRGHREKRS